MAMADLVAEFEVFRRHAMRCRKLFDTHSKLFHTDEAATDLLKRLAHNFFYDLSDWLADYHVILATRLTDPTKTSGKANLTSEYLVGALREKNLLTSEIEALSEQLRNYREKIVDWRNKKIAHLDLSESVEAKLGESHAYDDVKSFHAALDKFCRLVGDQFGASHLSTIRIAEGTKGVTGFLLKIKRCFKDTP